MNKLPDALVMLLLLLLLLLLVLIVLFMLLLLALVAPSMPRVARVDGLAAVTTSLLALCDVLEAEVPFGFVGVAVATGGVSNTGWPRVQRR